MKKWPSAAATALAVVALLATGCGRSAPSTEGGDPPKLSDRERLVGTWKEDSEDGLAWLTTFHEDGTFDYARSLPSTPDKHTASGKWSLEGKVIRQEITQSSISKAVGWKGSEELVSVDRTKLVAINGGSGKRAALTRVEQTVAGRLE